MLDAKMKDKLTSVVLCAVLVFYAMVPISDFQKPQKAEAIAPAIAAVTVFGTALTAMGVYVAGSTAAGYDANLGAIYDGFQQASAGYSDSWSQYVQDQGSFDQAMQSAVTSDGNVSLQTLTEHGFFDSVSTYTAYCVDNGSMVVGDTSTGSMVESFTIGDVSVNSMDASSVTFLPDQQAKYNEMKATYPYDAVVINNPSSSPNGYPEIGIVLCQTYPVPVSISGNTLMINAKCYRITWQKRPDGKAATWNYVAHRAYELPLSDATLFLNSSMDYVDTQGNASTVGMAEGDALATATADAYSGSVAVTADTVQPFEPTAEQLAAGFTALDVTAANTGQIAETTGDIATDVGSILTAVTTTIGGTLNDIKTGVNGLETTIGTAVAGAASTVVTGVGDAIGALGDVVGDISTTLDNVWQGAQGWWADVLAWLGATPLAQLIAQIIAAVNAGVMTLEGAISAVQSWISTGVAEIVGAIEGIGELIPSGAAEEEPAEPQTGTGVALPPNGLLPAFELDLRSKAPFAYIVAFFETFQDAANTFSSNASFYLDLKIPSVDENGLDPVGDELRLDAGEWLNYNVNGVTIAFIIRVLVTASICAGLIYVMYNAYLYAFRQ